MASNTYASLPSFPEDVPTFPLVIIDYLKLRANDIGEKNSLWNACTTTGFFYLKNGGVDVDSVWDVGKRTLELPLEEKSKYERRELGRTLKFKAPGGGIVDKQGTKDTIEFFNVWKDDALKYPDIPRNEYPEHMMNGMAHLKRFVEDTEKISRTIVEIFNDYLQLPPGALLERHKYDLQSFCELRILRNPANVEAGKISLIPHTDFGSLSTLYHQKIGGLQVFDANDQQWKYVKPLDGHAICNVGDALAVYSGGILRSSMHRVVPSPGEQSKHVRWSLAYFLRPHSAALMQPLIVSPLVAKAIEENPMPGIPPNTTNGEWVKRRYASVMTQNYKGPETWTAGRGTEPNNNSY